MLLSLLFWCTIVILNAQSGPVKSNSQKDFPPIHPGCESLDKQRTLQCLQKNISRHFMMKYNTRLIDDLGLPKGTHRVLIKFNINRNGLVDSIAVEAPHSVLKEEGLRTASMLPEFTPAITDCKNVSVKFTLPLTLYARKPKKKKRS